MYFKQRPWTGTDLRVIAKHIKENGPVFSKIIDDDTKDVMMKVSFFLFRDYCWTCVDDLDW